MDRFPDEVLSHIFSYLLTEREKHRLHDDTIEHALDVRLELGSHYISFCPNSWLRDGHWPEFNSAISRICDMPNLDCLEVRFSSFCNEEVFAGSWQEPSHVRKKTLEAISNILRDRESRPETSIIRELVLNCLEDTPLLKGLNDNLLHNINKLHIRVAYYDDENERPEFASYLSAEFKGKGLSFPCLRNLTLEQYIILRQDQFDWILEQRSLINLNLYSCKIVTHCLVQQPDFEDLGVDLNGWKKLPDFPSVDETNYSHMSLPNLEPLEPGWYMNDLRWSDLFDRIRQDLPLLENFSFRCSSWQNYFEGLPEVPHNNDLHSRYYTFDNGSWGWMLYMPANERPWSTGRDYFEVKDTPGTPVGLYERTEPADRLALETLMEVTRKRCDEKKVRS
ncbi:hypothetical protein FCIRC_11761 [Fusarium circinatum]|uniref:F-box domain-containing protein n=1 Tax=Fusarium circinatum TaxID=48490 RepID=A0A8H5T2I7_FUSCI|nr:hypothetical protein FCIRC_11761 [Fusarium circinatum]